MIQSVDRALVILEALGNSRAPLALGELAANLGLAKGTVHGLLRTLVQHQMVVQDADTGRYHLGPKVVVLSSSYLRVDNLRSRSLMWSGKLACRAGEAVCVAAPYGAALLLVHHVSRPDTALRLLEIGTVLPLHATALGKAILAYMPPQLQSQQFDAGLAPLTPRTVTCPDALAVELEQVRARHYALDYEEAAIGEVALAAPVFDNTGGVVGAIGVAGPRERMSGPDREEELGVLVLEAAHGISCELGGARWPLSLDYRP